MEEAWCAFADADAIEEGQWDFNVAMSKITRARVRAVYSQVEGAQPQRGGNQVWNRFPTTQQQLAKKHQGLTKAHQEDEARARRGGGWSGTGGCAAATH